MSADPLFICQAAQGRVIVAIDGHAHWMHLSPDNALSLAYALTKYAEEAAEQNRAASYDPKRDPFAANP